MRAYQDSYKKSHTTLTASTANEPSRFQHFDESPRNKGQVRLSHDGETDHFSYKISANVQSADSFGDSVASLDDSYISAFLGNWALTLGSYQQWQGPGWDTDLIRSNNARPMPSVFLTRDKSEDIDFPVLRWLGPWAFTTGISWMNDDRDIDNTLLWSMRLTIKPIHNLEFGVSRASQLCGDDRPCGGGTWKDMLIGNDNQSDEQPGNQLATVDIRWGDTVFDVPYGIYWQSMGEDAVRLDRFPPFQAKNYLYGADVSYQALGQYIRTYFEYSESQPTCGSYHGNCAYEHHIYKSGYRYNHRSVGSTYDNDARTFTLGFVGSSELDHQWQLNLRYLELNRDNSNRSGEYAGNQVTDVAENANQIEGIYQWPIFIGTMKVGLVYTYSTYENDIDADSDLDGWMKWEYEF
nr:capsule assembly Wzi family protein [Vibrio sp. S11_S32]